MHSRSRLSRIWLAGYFSKQAITEMKKRLPLLLLLACSAFAQAQPKHIEVPVRSANDTSLSYKWAQERIQEAGLADLRQSREAVHFRFYTEKQIIDIWSDDRRVFNGVLSNHTSSYTDDNTSSRRKKAQTSKSYFQNIPIDTASARQAYLLFTGGAIAAIPPQDSIPGWDPGFDGYMYYIESSTPDTYSFREYWTPSLYNDKLKEAAALCTFGNKMETLMDTERIFSLFLNRLPKGCYYSGGMYITCTHLDD